ncbi:MAG: TetR/AcrR family transcriptional regulator [Bacteroidota bacterium]
MIQIRINEKLYLKDPESSKLGRGIVEHGIKLIDELGFEHFTFKKLAAEINSTEASIYRYFENKHKLLIYLVSWYWNWLDYQLMFSTNNIFDLKERLRIAFKIVTRPHDFSDFIHIDKEALHRIVVSESPKAYLSKEVDEINSEGAFLSYKRVCRNIANIAKQINPDYPYPTALISTAVESAHHQKFFSLHLPSLTEISRGDDEEILDYLVDMIFRVLKCS